MTTYALPTIGFIPPTVIYDRMRAIDGSARELDKLVTMYVARDVFRVSWAAWYKRWREFFDKYQTDSAKAGALFYTEELAVQAEQYRREFEQWQAGYALEKDKDGKPVPKALSPVPPPPTVPTGPEKKEEPSGFFSSLFPSIPWWGWVLGIGAVGYVGYKAFSLANSATPTGIAIRKLTGGDPAGSPTSLSEKLPLLLSE